MAATPVLFDTDISGDVDDALALAVLLSAPEKLQLVAVTTVSGDTRARAWGAGRLLAMAGRGDVDLCAGVRDPLVRRRAYEVEMSAYGEGPAVAISAEAAPERILRAARETPGLELICVGPLTNLAHAVALDPRLPSRIARLSIMGGHIRRVAIGDFICPPGIDYNLCSDPEAAMTVLGAGFNTRLVTADVTLQLWMTEAKRAQLAASPRPVPQMLARLVAGWTPRQIQIFTGLGGTLAPDNAAFLHDPLVVLSLIDASSLTFERLHILPTIQRSVLRTLEVPTASGLGAEMECAMAVDVARARAEIIERVLGV